jgi:hypothetical protein
MADQTQAVPEEGRRDSFLKELSSAATKKALAPIAAAAATAGTTYLMKKASEIWEERLLPKMREKGGGQAVAKDALEKASKRLGGRSSNALSGLAGRLGDEKRPAEKRAEAQQPKTQTSRPEPDQAREHERKARQQRRKQRQRALEQSGST